MRKLGRYTQLTQTDNVLLERLASSPLNVGRIFDETAKEELSAVVMVLPLAREELYVVIIRCVQCQLVLTVVVHA